MSQKRRAYALWIVFLALFAAAHAWHLRADFPNFSPWQDWSKFTDEGWYGNAAIRAHLFGNWYIPGDFNPAAAVPVWPFLLWIVFSFTGVTVQAARALVVAFFFLNLFSATSSFVSVAHAGLACLRSRCWSPAPSSTPLAAWLCLSRS